MSDHPVDDSNTPPLWATLRPDEQFRGPADTASVFISGKHVGTFPSESVTLEWLEAAVPSGAGAQVRYHASGPGRKGYAGFVSWDAEGELGEEEPFEDDWDPEPFAGPPEPLLGDPASGFVRTGAVQVVERPPMEAPAVLAATLEKVTMRLLSTNTRLVERVLRTADTAITSGDRMEAQSRAVETLSAELSEARQQLTMAGGALDTAHQMTAEAVDQAQRARESAAAAKATLRATPIVQPEAPSPLQGVLEAVVEHVVDSFAHGADDGPPPAEADDELPDE